jgi:hypothetical protein
MTFNETTGFLLESKTFDNKILVQSTARPINTFTNFISEGDDTTDLHYVGNGTKMINSHEVGQSLSQTLYIDFNTKDNQTFFQAGFAQIYGASFDNIKLDVVPQTTTYTSGTNTNFNIYNGLIIPAAGNGSVSINPNDIKLVQVPMNIDNPNLKQLPGYWNADYNSNTKQFSNITAAIDGSGNYAMFSSEITFARIINMIINDSTLVTLDCNSVVEFVHGLRLKFTFTTNTPDHNWKINVTLKTHRKYTVNF